MNELITAAKAPNKLIRYEQERYKDSSSIMKRFAIKCKAVGIVEYDRVLNQYEDAFVLGKNVKNIFVYGEKE